jgi:hypothetical protein
MRIILITLFILIGGTVNSKEIKCEKAFCEDRDYIFSPSIRSSKTSFIKNGKIKEIKSLTINRGFTIKDSSCLPFYYFWDVNPTFKKLSKLIKDNTANGVVSSAGFKDVVEPYYSHYEMNACVPCGPNSAKKKGKKYTFCPLPLYQLDIFYKSKHGVANMPLPTEFEDALIVGRDFDRLEKLIYNLMQKSIVIEKVIIATGPKSEIAFMSMKIKKEAEDGIIFFHTTEFKTTLREQEIKSSELQVVTNPNTIKFVKKFIKKIQVNLNDMASSDTALYKNKELMLSLLPIIDEIKTIEEYATGITQYHIQTRN